MRLFDRTVAVITGAIGGIGSATARLFARAPVKDGCQNVEVGCLSPNVKRVLS
jgi:NADP-dependent 3-hydroxy acid dehydrogenase YdfG